MNSAIVKFCYKNASKNQDKKGGDKNKNFAAECIYCPKIISGNINSSSNFIDHTKVQTTVWFSITR
jgi:hypothetical protein